MARRPKTSPLEDIVMIAAKLPWWGGASLALISYIVLHSIASRPALAIKGPGQMGDAVLHGMLTTFALFGQVILPFAFGLAAVISAIPSYKNKKVYEKIESRSDVGSLNDMTWEDFEILVGEYYRRIGFQVSREGGNGPDGGIDIVLRKGTEKHLVQCKQWKAFKVGVQPVREFYGVMASRGAAGGYFVTSGVYTPDALSFVKGLNLELVDGTKLRKMIDIARKQPATAKAASRQTPAPRHEPATPACPKCNMKMVKRVARHGENAGREFWGCVAYPKCSGTRLVEGSVSPGQATVASPPGEAALFPETKPCPSCSTEMALRQFQVGPKIGQHFYGCVPCKKGYPAEQAPM
jgi:restriction system protein